MARPKGQGKTPGSGRKPGSPNKVTKETKEVIADLLRLTAPIYAEKMIEKARSKDPDSVNDFMSRFEKMAEFDVPKLSRSEVKADITGDLTKKIQTVYEQIQQEPDIPYSEPVQG